VIRRVKRELALRYPRLAGAYLSYLSSRQLHAQPLRRTPLGFQLMGHPAMQAGSFEPHEVAAVRQVLETASVFVDVGANVGFFTCLARQLGRSVIAVEPMPQNLEVLYTNLQANGFEDVEVFPVGLASRSGLATLFGGGTGASLIDAWAGAQTAFRRTIPLSTLDTILANRFQGLPLLVKIDVEGSEFGVLQGAQRTLQRVPAPVWLVEVCLTENHPESLNPHFREVFRLFWSFGYSARTVGAESRLVTPEDVDRWWTRRERDFGYVNYLFERG
jgi:FkbM family methyltransferase